VFTTCGFAPLIEGLGMSLPDTERTMRDNAGLEFDLCRFTVIASLAADPKVYEVTGLQRARELADVVARDHSAPITEADLRTMHSVILGPVEGAGRYKRFANTISGSAHEPAAPIDVPSHMSQLATWLSESDAHPVVKATIAHAWLTHIHPFEDGNGRMARLVANLVLARAWYPPVIVKAGAHKLTYLAASDTGEDVLPLLRVFSQLLKASFRQVERPETFIRQWRTLLAADQPSAFRRWSAAVDSLTAALVERLAPLSVVRSGSLDLEDYELLVRGKAVLSPRLLQVVNPADTDFELVLIATRSSSPGHPVLRFLGRSMDYRDPRTHRPLRAKADFDIDEIAIVPEAFPGSHCAGASVRSAAEPTQTQDD
jgi:fido (protein-threonine AMPylation protein)